MAIQLGLSEDEARRRFGSDFRNLTEQREGVRGFFPTSAPAPAPAPAPSNNLFTGLGVPNFPEITGDRNLNAQVPGGSQFSQLKTQLNQEGFASSAIDADLEALRKRREASIRGEFDVERGIRERGFASKQSLATQQSGVQGGGGSGLARSTTQEAGDVLRQEALQRSLKELKSAEAAAIDAGDTQLLEQARAERAARFTEFIQTQQEARLQKQQQIVQDQFNKSFGLSEDQFEFEQQQAVINNTLNVAGLTGMFEGETTLAGKQLLMEQAFEEAKLSGVFKGQPTLEGLSFKEALRSNLAREALERQTIAISGGRLALEQEKFAFDQAKNDITGLPEGAALRKSILSLSVGQQDQAFGAIASFKNAKQITDLLDKGVTTGPVEGRLRSGLKGPFGTTLFPGGKHFGSTTSDQNQFDAATTAFTANFIKAISGAQVSDKERQFLMGALPSANNQEQVNRDNLKVLLDFLENDLSLKLGVDLKDFPTEIPRAESAEDILGEFNIQ